MRKPFLLLFLLAWTSPVSADAVIDQLNAEYDATFVEDSKPYIVDEVLSPAYRKTFEKELCTGKKSKCEDKLLNTLVARFLEAYPLLDVDALGRRCNAHPVECKNKRTLESWARDSHNERAGVVRDEKVEAYRTKRQAAREQAQAAYQQAEDARRKRVSDMLGDVDISNLQRGLGRHSHKTRCKSTRQYDGSVETECD